MKRCLQNLNPTALGELHEEIELGLLKTLELFPRMLELPLPELRYWTYPLGKAAGQCASKGTAQNTRCEIQLHAQLFRSGMEHELRKTLIHEVTHALVYWVYQAQGSPYRVTYRVSPHGREFYELGDRIFNQRLTRCHSLELPAARRPVPRARHLYLVPGVGQITLGTMHHNRIQSGTHQYLIRRRYPIRKEHYLYTEQLDQSKKI